MIEIIIISLVILSYALGDGLHNRGKEKPITFLTFNLWLELSKLMRLTTYGVIIYLLGFEWRLVGMFLLLSYLLFMPFYNISSGNKLLYLGTGIYDTIVKVVIGNIWMYLTSIVASIVVIFNLKRNENI
jgi:hypothetical protein